MKINTVDITYVRESGFNYTSLFVHRGKKCHHYVGHSLHFFERANLLLNLFYAQGE